jgi:hypothetical protein
MILCGLPPASTRVIPNINGVSLFNWNDPTHGALSAVAQNPWFVGSTLKTHLASALAKVSVKTEGFIPERQLPSDLKLSPSIAFRHDKFYLIVGGIGSLGLQIAIWMYRVGGMSFRFIELFRLNIPTARCPASCFDLAKRCQSTYWHQKQSIAQYR